MFDRKSTPPRTGPWPLYHHASKTHRESIAREGLKASDLTSPGGHHCVYFSDTPWLDATETDIYVVDGREFEVEPDISGAVHEGEDWYVIFQSIPPDKRRRL